MKYLITGGAGFIGSHICETLCKQGHEIVCIDNLIGGTKDNLKDWWNPKTCTFVEESIYNYDKILPYFEGVDVVFHNAASKCLVCRDNPLEDLMTNSRGSWCVYEAARNMGVRKVVYASTGSVCDGKPKSFYGVTKYSAEAYLNAFNCYYPDFNYSIIRYFHVYGTRQSTIGVIPKFISNTLNNKPITIQGSGLQERRFTHVSDIVKANLLVANDVRAGFGPFNCVSDFKINIKSLAYKILDIMENPTLIKYESKRPDEVMNFDNISNDGLKMLGFEFMNDFDSGLRDTIKYYEERYGKKE
jgi:nucleoside-diphosphate-sugar epimerase